MTFLEILFIIIILVLAYVIYIQYHKNETLTQIVSDQQDIQEQVLERLENTLEEIKEVDLKGAFEADDEVGFVWKSIREIITTLSLDVVNAFNTEIKEEQNAEKKEE